MCLQNWNKIIKFSVYSCGWFHRHQVSVKQNNGVLNQFNDCEFVHWLLFLTIYSDVFLFPSTCYKRNHLIYISFNKLQNMKKPNKDDTFIEIANLVSLTIRQSCTGKRNLQFCNVISYILFHYKMPDWSIGKVM